MLTCLLAGVLAGPLVSHQADAVRVGDLVKNLAKQSGQRLECDGVVGKEPLVVQFEGRPLEDVLKIVADVAGAEWVTSQSGRKLERPVSLLRKQEKADLDNLAAQIADIQAKRLAVVEALPPFDDKEANLTMDRYRLTDLSGEQQMKESQRLTLTNPVARAAARIVAEIPATLLAKTSSEARVVCSDKPTRAQRPLADKGRQAVRDLRAQIRLMETAKANLGNPNKPRVNYGGVPDIGPGTLDAGYGKTVLSLKRTGVAMRYTLLVVDAKGAKITSGTGTIPDRNAFYNGSYPHKGDELKLAPMVSSFASLLNDVGYAWAGGTSAKLADGTTIYGSFGMGLAEANGDPADFGVGDLIGDPVDHDPVGVLAGPLLRQYAKSVGKPLIATVSDDTARALALGLVRKQVTTVGDIPKFLLQTGVPEESRSPYVRQFRDADWLVFEPIRPAAARKARFDRQALKTCVQAIRRTGTLSLADAKTYFATCPSLPSYVSVDLLYLSHASPSIDRRLAEYMFTPALPFLASVEANQWRDLQGDGVPYVKLKPSQQAIVRDWVYGDVDSAIARSVRDPSFGPGPSPLQLEPTEVFPDGVPAETLVRVDVSDLLAVVARTQTGYNLVVTADALGFSSLSEPSPFPESTKVQRVVLGYKPARQTWYGVKLNAGSGFDRSYTCIETKVDPAAKEVGWDALPKQILDRVALAREAFQRPRGVGTPSTPPKKPPG